MDRLLCNEIYWDNGKKTNMGQILINKDKITSIKPMQHSDGVYYRLQFDMNFHMYVEDSPDNLNSANSLERLFE